MISYKFCYIYLIQYIPHDMGDDGVDIEELDVHVVDG